MFLNTVSSLATTATLPPSQTSTRHTTTAATTPSPLPQQRGSVKTAIHLVLHLSLTRPQHPSSAARLRHAAAAARNC
ncbi:hypothetical protein E2C01_044724 [Portunus trituberculatus]|uniref:Uncharacterized protein n=1 Tax=Portunus trituberculatus TaxID=210409 RepID=A0A5B7FSV0_PORTR|nr:hypothetical protein [Portunus trituberculatus]